MHYVYVLISEKDQNLYIGSTPDLKRRITEHNSGKSFSTASRRPLKLLYYEAYLREKDARDREHSLKSRGQARKHLMTRLKTSLKQGT